MARIIPAEELQRLRQIKLETHTVDYKGYDAPNFPFDKVLRQNKRRIKSKDIELLTMGTDDDVDRSALMFAVGARLLESGIDFDQSFVLLRGSAINKFEGRSDEVQRIYEGLAKAREKIKNKPAKVGKLGWQDDSEFKATHFSPPKWQVEGMWVEASKGFIAAEPKSGKSTLVLDMALSVATGTPFLGYFPINQRGRVFVVQEEMDSGEVQWRRRKILDFKGVSETPDTPQFNPDGSISLDFGGHVDVAWLNESGFKLDDDDHRENLEKKVKRERPTMLIFDPLQRLLRTADVRSEKDMNSVFEWLDHIRRTYRTSIVLVHHLKKPSENLGYDDQMRMLGSQALASWYESLLMVTRKDTALRIKPTFRSKQRLPIEVNIDWGDDEDPIYVPTVSGKGVKSSSQGLLELVTESPGITYSEAMGVLGVSERTVRSKAKKLNLVAKRRKSKGDGPPIIELHPPKKKG